jgi:hypothetical protein
MLWRTTLAALLACLGGGFEALAQEARAVSRAELLYTTHCIACHNTEVHWRDKKLAKDGQTLAAEVDRWQRLSNLDWTGADVAMVAEYLNSLYYRFSPPPAR